MDPYYFFILFFIIDITYDNIDIAETYHSVNMIWSYKT